MPRLTCSCGATLNVNEAREGSEVRCPKCRAPLLIAGDADNDEVEAPPAPATPLLIRSVLLGLSVLLAAFLVYVTFFAAR